MLPQPRIPRKIEDFYSYMINTEVYLLQGSPEPYFNLNWQRLLWTEAEVTQWQVYKGKAVQLFPKYSDKQNQRTTAITDKFHELIHDTVAFDQEQKLLDRIAANPANTNVNDFEVFRIKRGSPMEDTTRTRPVSPIEESVGVIFKTLGGGEVKIACRTTTDASRASKPKNADSVQIAYKIGNPAPASSGDGTTLTYSTKAMFVLHLGDANAGQKLYLFARWFNTKYPELAGPWNTMNSVIIA